MGVCPVFYRSSGESERFCCACSRVVSVRWVGLLLVSPFRTRLFLSLLCLAVGVVTTGASLHTAKPRKGEARRGQGPEQWIHIHIYIDNMGCGASNAVASTPGEGAPTEVPESDVQKLARANRAYNQAVVRKEASDWDVAFRLYDEALAIRIAVYGKTSQVVGDTLYHVANARVLQGSRAGKRHA